MSKFIEEDEEEEENPEDFTSTLEESQNPNE
jgi:hypothetical protein